MRYYKQRNAERSPSCIPKARPSAASSHLSLRNAAPWMETPLEQFAKLAPLENPCSRPPRALGRAALSAHACVRVTVHVCTCVCVSWGWGRPASLIRSHFDNRTGRILNTCTSSVRQVVRAAPGAGWLGFFVRCLFVELLGTSLGHLDTSGFVG